MSCVDSSTCHQVTRACDWLGAGVFALGQCSPAGPLAAHSLVFVNEHRVTMPVCGEMRRAAQACVIVIIVARSNYRFWRAGKVVSVAELTVRCLVHLVLEDVCNAVCRTDTLHFLTSDVL